ncbi:hypothetical protein Tco_0450381 [Tanacetum coccineum]
MVHQLTKFHVQRVDMVINPPWNLPFLGAKGLTSPEQTATEKWESLEIQLEADKLEYDDLEYPPIQGRKISQLDEAEGTTLGIDGALTQGRLYMSTDLEPNFEFTAPEEVYTAWDEHDISTDNVPVFSTLVAEVSKCQP